MFSFLKLSYFKLCTNIILVGDGGMHLYVRIDSFAKTMFIVGPIVFLSEILDLWFIENQSFTLFTTGFVLANALIGAIAHKLNGDFRFETFFVQTGKMVGIITVVYLVLEGIVSPIGDNVVADGAIAVFQVATLLYPGSKILKNVFIWSGGEHPPRWLMQRVFNFKQNGDLKAFLDGDNSNTQQKKFDIDNFNK